MSKKPKVSRKKSKKDNTNLNPTRSSTGLQSEPSMGMPKNSFNTQPIPINSAKSVRKPFDKKPSEARLQNESKRRIPDGAGTIVNTAHRKEPLKPLNSSSNRETSGKKMKAERVKGNFGTRDSREPIKPMGRVPAALRKGNILQRSMRRLYKFGAVIAAFALGIKIPGLLGSAPTKRGKGTRIAVPAALGVLLIVILGGLIYFRTRDNAFSIEVDGERIAIIRMGSEDVSDELVMQAILLIENRLGSRILVNEQVEFIPARINTRYHQPVDEAILRIGEAFTYRVEAVAISVMGTRMTIVRNQYEADRILSSLKEPHLGQGVNFVEVGFVEDVLTTHIYTEEEYLDSIDTALVILTSTLETAQDYIVVPGDSLGVIAARFNMSLNELLSLNPQIIGTTIHPGDVIRLNVDRPLISVRTVEERQFTTEIEPTVEHVYNPAQRAPHRRTIQHGTLGQANIIQHVIRINSVVYSQEEVERIVTVPPRAEIIEVGTG